MASFILESNQLLLAINSSEICLSYTAHRWIPEYVEQIKAENLERVDETLEKYVSGEWRHYDRFGRASPVLDKEYVRFEIMERYLTRQKERGFRDCINLLSEENAFEIEKD